MTTNQPQPTGEMGTCPHCGSKDNGCFESVALGAGWVCRKPITSTEEFGEALADLVKFRDRIVGQPIPPDQPALTKECETCRYVNHRIERHYGRLVSIGKIIEDLETLTEAQAQIERFRPTRQRAEKAARMLRLRGYLGDANLTEYVEPAVADIIERAWEGK